jgi:hypothetical protein
MKRTEEMILEDLIANYQSQVKILKSIVESDERVMSMQAEMIEIQKTQIETLREIIDEIRISL